MDRVINKVEQYMIGSGMLSFGEHVVAGISGGADSMCLLFVLLALREKWDLKLCAVHVHHGIRGEAADKDAAFVEGFCESHGLLWKTYRGNVPKLAKAQGMSVEEAGRNFRYACFEQALGELGWSHGRIAVAHNRSDVTETLLLNLFRGSGLAGLSGIPPVRGAVIRPLLILSREEIEGVLFKSGWEFCTDGTNLSNDYTRNRIRNELLPYVEKHINANAGVHVYEAASAAAELKDYVRQQVEQIYPKVLCPDGSLAVNALKQQHKVIAAEIIRAKICAMTGQLKDIGRAHIEAVVALLEKEVGKRVKLPYGLWVIREYDGLRFLSGEDGEIPAVAALDLSLKLLDGRQAWLEIPGGLGYLGMTLKKREEIERIEENQYTKWLDYDKIKNGLYLRCRQSGDYLVVDAAGSKKPLRRLMIDAKIPRDKRDQWLLIADGSHIVWMLGGRISWAYKVTENTENILEIKYEGEYQNGR